MDNIQKCETEITTVEQLINELKKYPPNEAVELRCSYDMGFGMCGGKIQEIVLSEEKNALCLVNRDC